MELLLLATFIAYFVVVIGVGAYFYNRSAKMKEYFLADRQLNPYVVALSAQASDMRGWLLNNPRKRKTKRGINAFINAWLAREQDKGKGGNGRSRESGSNHRNVYEHAGIEI